MKKFSSLLLVVILIFAATATFASAEVKGNTVDILETTWTMESGAAQYTGMPIETEVFIEYNGYTLVKGKDYLVTYENNVEPGQSWVYVEGIGNYSGKYCIGHVDIIKDARFFETRDDYTIFMYDYDPYYTGDVVTPFVEVRLNRDGNRANGYNVSYANNINAGTAQAIVTLPGSTGESITIPYAIEPISVGEIEFKLSKSSSIFTGKAQVPTVTAYFNGSKLVKGKDYTVRLNGKAVNAGEYDVTVKGKGNFTGTKNFATYKITRKSITAKDVIVKLEYNKALFSGRDYRPEVYIKYNGKNLKASANGCEVKYKNNNATGKATVTVIGKRNGNFKGTVKKKFEIIDTDTAQSVRAYKSGHDDVTVFWNKIKKADGYYVYYKAAGEKGFKNYVKANGTSKTIKNLQMGKRYTFVVYPYISSNGNDAICKDGGQTYTYTLKKMSKPKVKKVSSGKVKISWSKYDKIYGGYQIAQTNKKTGKTIIITVNGSDKSSATMKAVSGKKYSYKVRMFSKDKKSNGKRTTAYAPWSNATTYIRK